MEGLLDVLDKNNIIYEKIKMDIFVKNRSKNKLKLVTFNRCGRVEDGLNFASVYDGEMCIVVKNMNKNKLKLITENLHGHDADELDFADILDKNNEDYYVDIYMNRAVREEIEMCIVVKNMNKNKLKLITENMHGHDADELDFADILDKNNEDYYVDICRNHIVVTVLINTIEITFYLKHIKNHNFEEIYSRFKYLTENYIFYSNDIEHSYILQDGKEYYLRITKDYEPIIVSENNRSVFYPDSIEDIILIMSKNFPDSIKQTDIKIALKH